MLPADRTELDCSDCLHHMVAPRICGDCTRSQESTGTWLPLFFAKDPMAHIPDGESAPYPFPSGAVPRVPQTLADTLPPRLAATGATKFDEDKPRTDLLPFEALEEVAKVYAFGAKKYAAHNWRKGFVWSRPLGAALRHLYAWARGQDKDPESGLSHLTHAAFCVLTLLSFEITGGGTDDRAKNL